MEVFLSSGKRWGNPNLGSSQEQQTTFGIGHHKKNSSLILRYTEYDDQCCFVGTIFTTAKYSYWVSEHTQPNQIWFALCDSSRTFSFMNFISTSESGLRPERTGSVFILHLYVLSLSRNVPEQHAWAVSPHVMNSSSMFTTVTNATALSYTLMTNAGCMHRLVDDVGIKKTAFLHHHHCQLHYYLWNVNIISKFSHRLLASHYPTLLPLFLNTFLNQVWPWTCVNNHEALWLSKHSKYNIQK